MKFLNHKINLGLFHDPGKHISLHKKWSFPLRISSHLLKKSLMENFIFYAVNGKKLNHRFLAKWITAWKVAKYGVFLVCVFPHSDWVIPNAGKCGPEKTPYLDNFHAVNMPQFSKQNIIISFNTFQPEDSIFNDKVK